jgi:hypothetical protein
VARFILLHFKLFSPRSTSSNYCWFVTFRCFLVRLVVKNDSSKDLPSIGETDSRTKSASTQTLKSDNAEKAVALKQSSVAELPEIVERLNYFRQASAGKRTAFNWTTAKTKRLRVNVVNPSVEFAKQSMAFSTSSPIDNRYFQINPRLTGLSTARFSRISIGQ